MKFDVEKTFEDALVALLAPSKGWDEKILMYPTEEDLIANWAQILFENNREIDCLNEQPLTDTEMEQILQQVNNLKTPIKLNGFINGKSVAITRDNENDKLHYGKEVRLKIYDRNEIAGGKSRYQIARQPRYKKKCPVLQNRRGDITLLINGMPVIHIELKRSDTPISKATHQIEEYSHEGIFTGIFSLVQVFVAMTPEETLYFANPGPEGKFNSSYYFHWADFNNQVINEWEKIAGLLLSIPKAHQLIGFYTVADKSDNTLKVMRSYQIEAAENISDVVRDIHWGENNLRGGYIWHTTGSGKTMTSFKTACLIAEADKADKVVFLVDRIELATQSTLKYQGFADAEGDVVDTDDCEDLVSKLKNTEDDLIVTSIQKMSRITIGESKKRDRDIEKIQKKRKVIIIDECHRDTFGDMLINIKHTFPESVLFGFTGTPIDKENQKKLNTTATVFGNELHRYTLADAITDKNVLGFDPRMVLTYKDKDLRKTVALEKSKSKTEEEAISNKTKAKIYYHYMNDVPMAGYTDESGKYHSGIEDHIPSSQYNLDKHRIAVVNDIKDGWLTLSRNNKFHAILATSSIVEAIAYYRLFRELMPSLKVTALFDPSDNHNETSIEKIDGLKDIILDYNSFYSQKFSISNYGMMRKDISARMSHTEPYLGLHKTPEMQINLLIVVDQMLTGFDSKWVNTLYLDKMLEQEHLIQAFSRTNRLFGPDKPFGNIRFYRRPHTMKRNIDDAISHYSGDRPQGLFVEQLEYNLHKLNEIFADIDHLFSASGIKNFERLPDDINERQQFVKLFNQFNRFLEAARIQGYIAFEKMQKVEKEDGTTVMVEMLFDENQYNALLQRYNELSHGGGGGGDEDVPYDIETYITEIDTGKIDADYMNHKFDKWLKVLAQPDVTEEEKNATLDELHKSFSTLTQEEQNYAYIFLHDIENGDVKLKPGKTLRDYITEYLTRSQDRRIHHFAETFGLDEQQLRDIILSGPTADNIDIRGRLTNLKKTANLQLAKEYFEREEGRSLALPIVIIKLDNLLREFILGKADDKFVDEEPSENEKSSLHIIDIYEFRQQDNKEGFVPLYTLRAACGYFEDGEVPEEEGWVDASGNGFTPDPKRHFAVHAKGNSMQPKIQDGDICVFEWYKAGSRNGEIVLTQSSEFDTEYGGKYTIKKYRSEKVVTEEGWQHSKVELIPLNKDFDVIELDEETEYRTIGVLKCVLSNE